MKKIPPLRDTRAAAEAVARSYADNHRQHDPLIETRLMASYDGGCWKIIAVVDDPERTVETVVNIGGFHLGNITTPVYMQEFKEHEVVLRKRKS